MPLSYGQRSTTSGGDELGLLFSFIQNKQVNAVRSEQVETAEGLELYKATVNDIRAGKLSPEAATEALKGLTDAYGHNKRLRPLLQRALQHPASVTYAPETERQESERSSVAADVLQRGTQPRAAGGMLGPEGITAAGAEMIAEAKRRGVTMTAEQARAKMSALAAAPNEAALSQWTNTLIDVTRTNPTVGLGWIKMLGLNPTADIQGASFLQIVEGTTKLPQEHRAAIGNLVEHMYAGTPGGKELADAVRTSTKPEQMITKVYESMDRAVAALTGPEEPTQDQAKGALSALQRGAQIITALVNPAKAEDQALAKRNADMDEAKWNDMKGLNKAQAEYYRQLAQKEKLANPEIQNVLEGVKQFAAASGLLEAQIRANSQEIENVNNALVKLQTAPGGTATEEGKKAKASFEEQLRGLGTRQKRLLSRADEQGDIFMEGLGAALKHKGFSENPELKAVSDSILDMVNKSRESRKPLSPEDTARQAIVNRAASGWSTRQLQSFIETMYPEDNAQRKAALDELKKRGKQGGESSSLSEAAQQDPTEMLGGGW